MNKAILFKIIILISIASMTEAEISENANQEVMVTNSVGMANTINDINAQTTIHSADINTIRQLAEKLTNINNITSLKTSWDEWNTTLSEVKTLIEQQPKDKMQVFEPLFEPLFSKVGYGGAIRMESAELAELLVHIGKPAVGFLIEKLKSKQDRERSSAIQILTEIGEPNTAIVSAVCPLVADKDELIRSQAIECLGKLGKKTGPAEKLQTAFNDTSISNRIFARAAYIHIGYNEPEHIHEIAKYLKSYDENDKDPYPAAAVAASALGDIGPDALIVEPNLIDALNYPKASIRHNSAEALGKIGANSQNAINSQIEILKNDTSPKMRRSAALSLGMIGPKAQKAIPILAEILRQADKESRINRTNRYTGWWTAAEAVGKIGGADAIPVLEEALQNNDPDIRKVSSKALDNIRKDTNTPATQDKR